MSKFKKFLITWLIPIGMKAMKSYLESHGYVVCEKDKCLCKR